MTRPQSKDKNKMVSRGPVTCHQGKAPGAADASSSISKFRVQPREDRPISDFKTVNTIRAEPTFTQSNYPILQVHNPHDQRINGHRSNASGKNADQFIDQLVQKPGMDEEESPLQLRQEKESAAYLKRERFLLTPKNLKRWKVSKNSTVSAYQKEILDNLWNHSRAGTMAPFPLRKVEREFTRLNRARSIAGKIANKARHEEEDWCSYQPFYPWFEADINAYDENAQLPQTTCHDIIFKTYFRDYDLWFIAYCHLQEGNVKAYLSLFGKESAADENKIKFIRQKRRGNKIMILGVINPDILNFSLNMGHVKYLKIESENQFSNSPPMFRKFARFLIQQNNGDSAKIWVKIFSACPLHNNKEWRNIADMRERKPEVFPSIHVVSEKVPDKPQRWISKEDTSHGGLNPETVSQYDVRMEGLDRIQRALSDYSHLYIWRDCGRFIFRALQGNNLQNSISDAIIAGELMPVNYSTQMESTAVQEV
ncbi:hypothetical protein OIU74_009574 [Salix koriyanagi]|uniref:Uncharacterized protein n=1 Tax=Salix koriyanagi TaxID=2511006 RepID=A0A9Q0TSL7_9ROSI|nr:hypothetical protein OIU74_009574 [Salix koriyanagi]